MRLPSDWQTLVQRGAKKPNVAHRLCLLPVIAPQNAHPPMSDNNHLVERVRHSLNRLGYYHIQAEDLGNGKVRLSGKIRSFEERAIVVAAARTVSGVTSITIKLRV